MQQVLPQVVVMPPQSRHPVIAQFRRPPFRSRSAHSHSPGIAGVWGDSLRAFCLHIWRVLLIAWVGFAGVGMLTDHLRVAVLSAPCSLLFEGRCIDTVIVQLLSLVQAGVATLAQGLIALLVIHPEIRPRAGGAAAFRRLSGWPALLVGCLVYSVLLTAGQQVAFGSLQALHLRLDAHTQALNASLEINELHHMSRAILAATVQGLQPSPPLPMAGILGLADPYVPQPARPVICSRLDSNHVRINLDQLAEYIAANCENTVSPSDVAVAVLAGALILATETLLRFRIVTALIRPENGASYALLGPLLRSMHVGLLHFRVVTTHIWALRLTFLTAQVLFCTLPLLVVQRHIMPAVQSYLPGMVWLVPTLLRVGSAGVALVSGIFAAFSVVYDARLFLALTQARSR